MILFNLDDFANSREENPLSMLIEMKDKYPDLKVTLFTILGRWNADLLRAIYLAFGDWIEFAAHGLLHDENEEVLRWTKKQWFDILNLYETVGGFKRIFKAPNWQMSRLGYEVLKELEWAVAVRKSQIDEVPSGAMYYSFEEQSGIHGHTWLLSTHEKDGMFKDWNESSQFDFISRNLRMK